jgi:carbamoyltransferase
MDGVGEWATSSIGVGRGHEIELISELRFPHSLGLLYSAFTYFTGFKVNSGEYKVMGLAPYGEPKYVQRIKDHLLEIGEDGSLWMNMEYFTYPHGLTMTGSAFERLFDGPARRPEGMLTQREMDLACSIQAITEEVMLKMARFAQRETSMRDLCLAGGVALNCVGNGRILREGIVDQLWIQPAAGDAGGALGVALSLWHRHLQKPRLSPEASGAWERTPTVHGGATVRAGAAGHGGATVRREAAGPGGAAVLRYSDGMNGGYLGPRFNDDDVCAFLQAHGCVARRLEPEELAEEIAALVAREKVVGLLRGRMEFGPRALGGRSIIGDPRSPRTQSVMNLKIKFRESFRPFAPSVLREHVGAWFDFEGDSPYMLLVADVCGRRRLPVPPVSPPSAASSASPANAVRGLEQLNVVRSTIPAVTHIDYSARIQTVRRETNPFYYSVIEAFYRRTLCPVIVNTSFNVRGEPIVCSPEDAYRCFMRTNIDVLVLESFMLVKDEQAPVVAGTDESWRTEFVLD